MIAYLSIFLRLAKSSIRLSHSCHCLCASDFHGIRLLCTQDILLADAARSLEAAVYSGRSGVY